MGKFKTKRMIARIAGNWGTSFFGPLVSTNIASSYYEMNIDFGQSVIIALIASTFVTALVFFREVEKWGHAKRGDNNR